jgi:hypothetical protein
MAANSARPDAVSMYLPTSSRSIMSRLARIERLSRRYLHTSKSSTHPPAADACPPRLGRELEPPLGKAAFSLEQLSVLWSSF